MLWLLEILVQVGNYGTRRKRTTKQGQFRREQSEREGENVVHGSAMVEDICGIAESGL